LRRSAPRSAAPLVTTARQVASFPAASVTITSIASVERTIRRQVFNWATNTALNKRSRASACLLFALTTMT
jgi:hypothetical protein